MLQAAGSVGPRGHPGADVFLTLRPTSPLDSWKSGRGQGLPEMASSRPQRPPFVKPGRSAGGLDPAIDKTARAMRSS
jgi:hypothetical protein